MTLYVQTNCSYLPSPPILGLPTQNALPQDLYNLGRLERHGELDDADIALQRRVLNLVNGRSKLQVGDLLEEVRYWFRAMSLSSYLSCFSSFWVSAGLTEGTRQLSLGEMFGDAAMRAKAKAQRIILGPLPVHVELVGVRKDFVVAVG